MRFGRDGRKLKSHKERDRKRMIFIASCHCFICGNFPVEVAHLGSHGMGQRPDDDTCAPLCVECHRTGKHAFHRLGSKGFWIAHDLERDAIILHYQALYQKSLEDAA